MTISRVHKTIAATAGAALLVAGLAASAFAQGGAPRRGPGFGPGGHGRGGLPMLARLDLSDAQRQQVREVASRHREELQAAGRTLREAHAAQRRAVETLPADEALIRSTSDALAAAQTEMALLQARMHGEIWALLTPEQQARAAELKAERDARMKQRRERLRQRRQ